MVLNKRFDWVLDHLSSLLSKVHTFKAERLCSLISKTIDERKKFFREQICLLNRLLHELILLLNSNSSLRVKLMQGLKQQFRTLDMLNPQVAQAIDMYKNEQMLLEFEGV